MFPSLSAENEGEVIPDLPRISRENYLFPLFSAENEGSNYFKISRGTRGISGGRDLPGFSRASLGQLVASSWPFPPAQVAAEVADEEMPGEEVSGEKLLGGELPCESN